MRPAFTSGDATVTLTATITKNGVAQTKSYTLTVKRQPATDAEAVAEDKTNLSIAFGGTDSAGSVTQNLTLPTAGSNGTTISWASSEPAIIAADGTVTRPTYDSGEEPMLSLTLTATITKNGVSETKTFTLTVLKISTDAALASLTFNKGKLQPAFSVGTTSYLNAAVPFSSEASPAYNDTQSVTVTATAANSGATITINGTSVPSGSAFTIANLAVGKNSAVIMVTAQDGTTTTTYTVEVYRAIPIFKTGAAELTGYTFVAGEDGQSNRGVSWPSSRFTAVGTDSIKDEMTGLVWLKSPDSTTRTFANAITWCEELSTEGATVTDWRLPNVRELRSLVHYGQSNPYAWLNGQGFTNMYSDYWSSTTSAHNTGEAWGVDMVGEAVYNYKISTYYVWPVKSITRRLPVTGQTTVYMTNDDGSYRAGADVPSTRFCDNGDGTVTDNMTGLMWLKSPDSMAQTWEHAITHCEGLVSAGHSDWRVPTVHELETLVNYAQSAPATWLNQDFSNVKNSYYWSSTTYAPNTGSAWSVSMDSGGVSISNKVGVNYVWSVRSAAAD